MKKGEVENIEILVKFLLVLIYKGNHLLSSLLSPWAERFLAMPPTPSTKNNKYRDKDKSIIIIAIDETFI